MVILTRKRCLFGIAWLVTLVGLALVTPSCGPAPAPSGDDGSGSPAPGDGATNRPLTTFAEAHFLGSGNCTACHFGLADSTGADVSIDRHWRASMMANSSKDPFFLASVDVEVQAAPAMRDTIEDICATCHMPMARTQAVADGSSTRILDDGFANPSNALHDPAMDGVSCTLCHQIQDDFRNDPLSSFNGGYTIDTSTVGPSRPLFGPYPTIRQGEVMTASVDFTPTFGVHIFESGLCATCHTFFTPTLDANGEIVGEFPEQAPFQEWQHSDFGNGIAADRTCQDCHMPQAAGGVTITRIPAGLPSQSPFFQHQFHGGNVFMLRLLRDNINALELTAPAAAFDDAIARTQAQLSTRTASLSIVSATRESTTLTTTLNVTSVVGHKLPTGFPSRRVWIHLTVTDSTDETVFESGRPLANGAIDGVDADSSSSTFEPHYETIADASQVQVYESIMLNTDAEVTYTLLRAAEYAKDNRILPSGFDKTTAHNDIAVHGAARADENFVGGSDRITYVVEVLPGDGPYVLSAELLYQSISFRFAEDIRNRNSSVAQQFTNMFDAADQTPALIAAVTVTVP